MKKKSVFKLSRYLYPVFWVLLIGSFLVGGIMQFGKYQLVAKEKDELSVQLEAQAQANDELRKELEYYGSDTYVENIARDRLGLVKPDETVYINSTN